MIPPNLPGEGGIMLILMTLCLVAIIVLVTFLIAIYHAVYGTTKTSRRKVLQLFVISLITLIVDVLFLYFYVVTNGGKSRLAGEGLDSFSLKVWLPIHLFVGFSSVVFVWIFNRKSNN